MLKAKRHEILDEHGTQLAIVLATNISKRQAARWAQFIVERENFHSSGLEMTPRPRKRDRHRSSA